MCAESFLPQVNGVTNSVLRMADHLSGAGHEVIVIAAGSGADHLLPYEVERVPGIALPRYAPMAIGLPGGRVHRLLDALQPDVVHLAAPVVLGAAAALGARRRGVPSVAVYQTDLAGFASQHGLGWAAPAIWSWLRVVHRQAAVTLAPSTHAVSQLRRHGIDRVRCWPRGVDGELFNPEHRDEGVRAELSPDGRPIVGYVGRLAPEKSLHLLAPLAARDDVQLVVVGDGPSRRELESRLRGARFTGLREGHDLARTVASLDVFVHPGRHETFCQAIQEAQASGVAVVAPACGGPVDLICDGVNGLLWPPDRPGRIIDAVDRLVVDGALRRRLGAAARRSVTGRTWSAVGRQLEAHYQRVLGGDQPSMRMAA